MESAARDYCDSVRRLAGSLPPLGLIRTLSDPIQQARAALSLVVRPTENCSLGPVGSQPESCPNCGSRTSSDRTPYCSTKCREEAGFIRQTRGAILQGAIFEEERQASLGQVLWHLLGGGFPGRLTLAPERARARVLERTGGRCEICGAAAVSFDHIGSACNRPINLRPVCMSCAVTRPYGDAALLESPEVRSLIEDIAIRIGSPFPIRSCDDPANWQWRAFLAARAEALSTP